MSDEKNLEQIKIKQFQRSYLWRSKKCPIPAKIINENSANMHLIPSSKEIFKKFKSKRVGNIIHFKGFLVKARSENNWRWNTSLNRKDIGNGACKLVWVEEFEIY